MNFMGNKINYLSYTQLDFISSGLVVS